MIHEQRSLVFVFVDGLGIGGSGSHNPFTDVRFPSLEALFGGPLVADSSGHHAVSASGPVLLDATLGIDGLPQSGTGQATLFTGINCAELAGRHFGPFPHTRTFDVLRSQSIFARLIDAGHGPSTLAFANAFPARFFQYAHEKNRWTVTTRCAVEAGIRVRSEDDLSRGDAIPADVTGVRFPLGEQLGLPITPDQAAQRVANLLGSNSFVLFEYFRTDKAGHAMDREMAIETLRTVDDFVGHLLASIDLERTTFVLTSDHGNIEDLSTKSHTRNPVPLLLAGAGRDVFTEAISLVDVVAPCINWLTSR